MDYHGRMMTPPCRIHGREMLDRLGAQKALQECQDWAESAEAAGDPLTVGVWRDIASARRPHSPLSSLSWQSFSAPSTNRFRRDRGGARQREEA
jgi:hypothetical protein